MSEILDILDDKKKDGVSDIILLPPADEDSDGYDDSDTEDGLGEKLTRNILQVKKKMDIQRLYF